MGGFLCGWSFFLAARSGGIAVVAVGFSIYLSYFVPLTPLLSKVVSVGLILFLSWVNYRGIRVGATVQNVFTSLKVLGLALLIGSAFLSPAHAASPAPAAAASFSLSQFGVAMIACLWAYNGWFAISLVAGEVRNPQRNLPLSLMMGVAVVIGALPAGKPRIFARVHDPGDCRHRTCGFRYSPAHDGSCWRGAGFPDDPDLDVRND